MLSPQDAASVSPPSGSESRPTRRRRHQEDACSELLGRWPSVGGSGWRSRSPSGTAPAWRHPPPPSGVGGSALPSPRSEGFEPAQSGVPRAAACSASPAVGYEAVGSALRAVGHEVAGSALRAVGREVAGSALRVVRFEAVCSASRAVGRPAAEPVPRARNPRPATSSGGGVGASADHGRSRTIRPQACPSRREGCPGVPRAAADLAGWHRERGALTPPRDRRATRPWSATEPRHAPQANRPRSVTEPRHDRTAKLPAGARWSTSGGAPPCTRRYAAEAQVGSSRWVADRTRRGGPSRCSGVAVRWDGRTRLACRRSGSADRSTGRPR